MSALCDIKYEQSNSYFNYFKEFPEKRFDNNVFAGSP